MRNLFLAAVALPAVCCASADHGFDYSLAFDPIEVPYYDRPALTSDGRQLAFTLQHRPADVPTEQPFDPYNTYPQYFGAKVQVSKVTERGEISIPKPACAEGNSWGAAWSHDNRQLAFHSDASGKPALWIYDGTKCRAVSSLLTGGYLGEAPKWSLDDRTVYVISPERKSEVRSASAESKAAMTVHVFHSGAEASTGIKAQKSAFVAVKFSISAVDVASGESRILVPAEGDSSPVTARISPSGLWMTYLTQSLETAAPGVFGKELWALRLPDGQPIKVADGLPELWSAESRLIYSWDSRAERLVYWKDGGVYLVEFDEKGPGVARRLAPELGRLESTVYRFARDGRLIVGTDPIYPVRNQRPDAVPRGLAVLSLDGGAPVRWTFDKDHEFIGLLNISESTVWQPQTDLLTARFRDKRTGQRDIVRFDLRTGREQVLWEGYGKRGDSVVTTADHKLLLDLNQGLQTPPNISVFSDAYTAMGRPLVLDPRLADARVGVAETFRTLIPNHTGAMEEVRTTVLLPPGAKRGDRLPAVVMIYPGSDLSNLVEAFGGGMGNSTPNLLYTSRGFAVVMPFVKLGPEQQQNDVAKQMADALVPQILRAGELGYVDTGRLAVSGQSYGGYSTALLASQTNLFRAGVAVNGVFDLGGSYGAMDKDGFSINVGWAENSQGRLGVPVWTNPLRYLDNSPYYRADRIFTPLLLVSGEGDLRVPSDESKKLFVALRRLDKPAELALYAGQGHVISEWTQASAVDVSQRMIAFLSKHLRVAR